MMRNKIGLFGEETQDENLINDLLKWMSQNKIDYTNTFCSLMKSDIKKEKLFQDSNFIDWQLVYFKSSVAFLYASLVFW